MKINVGAIEGSVAVPGTTSSDKAGTAPTPALPVDVVTTGDTNNLKASIALGVNIAATERSLRLTSLAQQVRAGTYRPSASRLADEILEQAQMDARIAQSLL
jgi:hypothetical protein